MSVATWIRDRLRRIIPAEWSLLQEAEDGIAYRRGLTTVIISGDLELDGRRWIHLSIANPERLPKWEELVELRDTFLGDEFEAVMVVPKRSKHINIHRFCLHLFHCVDANPLPDFTRGSGRL